MQLYNVTSDALYLSLDIENIGGEWDDSTSEFVLPPNTVYGYIYYSETLPEGFENPTAASTLSLRNTPSASTDILNDGNWTYNY